MALLKAKKKKKAQAKKAKKKQGVGYLQRPVPVPARHGMVKETTDRLEIARVQVLDAATEWRQACNVVASLRGQLRMAEKRFEDAEGTLLRKICSLEFAAGEAGLTWRP